MTGARTILHNTTVVDVRDGSARRGVDITIDGGRISSIAPSVDDHPDGVAVVDARGTYAVPGFCDMHAHPLSDRNDAEPALRLMLACGVTGFRQMGGSRTLLDDREPGTTVTLLLSGPGRGPVSSVDVMWSKSLTDMAERFAVPLEPIFRANDESIELVG